MKVDPHTICFDRASIPNGNLAFISKSNNEYLLAIKAFRSSDKSHAYVVLCDEPYVVTATALNREHVLNISDTVLMPTLRADTLTFNVAPPILGKLAFAADGIFIAAAFNSALAYVNLETGEISQNAPAEMPWCSEWKIAHQRGDALEEIFRFPVEK